MSSLWLVPPEGEPIRIDKGPATVGRDSSADIVINHQSVSRKHAVLELSGQDWMVADQKSGNGTWIDGQRVIRAMLRAGQNLRLGAVSFTVSLQEPRTEPGPQRKVEAPSAAARRPPPLPPSFASSNPTPVPAAAQPSGGTLSVAEAAEILGVAPGAPAHEVRKKYQKIYNDLQIRLTNAPTASLKRMYQKNLQSLKAAAEVISPGALSEKT